MIGTAILLVLAATTYALGEIDRGAEVDVRSAYRLAFARWRALLGAFLIASVLVGLLSLTVVLTPVALVVIVLAALFVPVIAFEGASALASLRRSAALVRIQILKTVVLLAGSLLLAGIVGPILGTLLILVTGLPFPVANVVAGVTYAVLMPYVGLTMAYLYFDARVRSELAAAEADLAGHPARRDRVRRLISRRPGPGRGGPRPAVEWRARRPDRPARPRPWPPAPSGG